MFEPQETKSVYLEARGSSPRGHRAYFLPGSLCRTHISINDLRQCGKRKSIHRMLFIF